ncbi:protein kinase kin1 [Zalerion maritima]|uniref:non-specific serine/threonine protein kinase n=1 Tax=Zalerion maritima TaxID=339359 RepID=A0AAD5RHA8_9PEZI|nr:protein kinase kin1 [Zalerion maritima]
MTTAISTGAEAPHHNHNHTSSTRAGASGVSRSQSTRSSRPPSAPSSGLPHRAASTRHHNNTARQKDYEPGSVTQSQSHHSSRRSSSRGRPSSSAQPSSSAAQNHDSSSRTHRRSASRTSASAAPTSPRRPDNMAGTTAVANNGGPVAAPQPPAAAATDSRSATKHTSRSRTTIPTQSGKWILGKTIGAGSMGKVKLARKEDSSEQVACKIIPRSSTDDGHHHSRADKERADQSKEIRTAREAAIVTLLQHPYICGLRDVVRTNYHWYMLFEYVNGGQMLDYIISHGKLKEKQARKFSRQIASALDYCHRNSIVHRDLKIENILISKTGNIKIIDFGLSNLFAFRGHLKTFCGSLYFAAPELLQARPYTGPEVDVWSFGIVLYVLVCGKVPFDDQSMPALHAKIKKGLVDYPNWLSSECKHLLSRMLITDPKERATMMEVMAHPWMMKGYPAPPDNGLPSREPLTFPLDNDVINAMTGFNFGPPDAIRNQLLKVVESEEYQRAVKMYRQEKENPPPVKEAEKKRGFGFDFYKRRGSMNSRDTLTTPSSEALQIGNDPLNAFHPLISIYYLVKEKQERDLIEQGLNNNTVDKPQKTSEKEAVSEIKPPQEAHTNTSAYEMPGEKATGGRSRPRARTHGEDEVAEGAKNAQASPTKAQESTPEPLPRKESTAAGILRRFSTRRRKEPERLDKDRSHPPVVHVHSPAETPSTPRKSFSIRRSRRDREEHSTGRLRSGSSQPQHRELLSPPLSAGGGSTQKKGLGRSTSVNSADFRRRGGGSTRSRHDPPPTSGSDHSTIHDRGGEPSTAKTATIRAAKSLGHARRESIQARRRLRREEAREANVPEETDQDLAEQSSQSAERLDATELAKPVFLKGLFSVSTTSTKSVLDIRKDIRRVLRQLGVEFTEIKGGFSCKHTPSIDLAKVPEMPTSPAQTPGHGRQRFSFGALRGGDRDRDEMRDDRPPTTPRTSGKAPADRSDSNSDFSEVSVPRENGGSSRRIPGETSTHVQNDLGGSMVLEFEIFIVKVPVLSLHGIQFKRMAGNTWQYKNMADQILKELRL